jgi:cell division septal protein FtsQ
MMKRNDRPGRTSARWKEQNRGVKVNSGSGGHHIGRYLILLVIVAACLFAGGKYAVDYAAALPVFTVHKVVVGGARYISRDKIIASSGIKPGCGLFNVNLVNVAIRLNQEYAARDFIVYRRLPDTIVIKVQERKPVALLGTEKVMGVDNEGVPLPYVGQDMVSTLPIVSGIKSAASMSDPQVKARVVSGLKLLDTISKNCPELMKRISDINVSTMGINLDNGLEVIIGETDWPEKVQNLEKWIDGVTGRLDSVKTLDLSHMRFDENSDQRINVIRK